jgi:hypothetical protein
MAKRSRSRRPKGPGPRLIIGTGPEPTRPPNLNPEAARRLLALFLEAERRERERPDQLKFPDPTHEPT